MAMIKCPECGKDISSSAEKCPNCGYPISGKQKGDTKHQQAPKKKKGILWKILIFIVACCIIGAVFGKKEPTNSPASNAQTGTSSDSHTVVSNDISKAEQETSAIATDATESEANMIDVDISDCHVKYLRHEIANNMAGEKCLVIYYEFTNNSKDNKAFDYTISDKAFQGGVELQSSLFHVNDESKDSGAEIQPGTTITVASGFLLRDESDVQLEVNAYISFSSKPKGSMTLTLMQ